MSSLLRLLLPFTLLFLGYFSLHAQCGEDGLEVVMEETFDGGIPVDWAKSGAWKSDSANLGLYPNPGTGNWAYLPLMKTSSEIAYLESPEWDLSVFENGRVVLSFELFTADYQERGRCMLDIWNGTGWENIMIEESEFAGEIAADISDRVGPAFKFRVRFDPEGGWAWGMGIDEVRLSANLTECGNGKCENGENFDTCPGDCPPPVGPAPAWISIGKNLNAQSVTYRNFMRGTGCDDCSEPVDLGFGFALYGQNFTQAYLNANGSFTFGGPSAEYHPEPFCLNGPKMIAAFYADMDLTYSGSLKYYVDPDHHYFIATWTNAPYYGCERPCVQTNTFQIILTDGSIRQVGTKIIPAGTNVIINYGDLGWSAGTSTGGVNGFGGQPAVVGINHGDGNTCLGYGAFEHPGYTYAGKTDSGCGASGVDFLDYQTLCFNAGIGELQDAGEPLPLYVEPGDHVNRLSWYFLPENDIIRFEIARSSDGQLYELLGEFDPAAVKNLVGPGYSFEDKNLSVGRWFYRVQCITRGGQTITSAAVQGATIESQAVASMQILSIGPNPFESELNVRMMSVTDQEVSWQLMDMSGRPVMSGTWLMATGRNERRFAVPNLPAGQYIWVANNKLEVVRRNLIKL